MSESFQDFVNLIPTWVAATQRVDIPAQPDEEELERRTVELRTRLRDGTWQELDLIADDQGLAVLSRLCFVLSALTVESDILCEAEAAHELASELSWPEDLLGEKNEILSQLALVAWRQSRQFGSTKSMLAWEKKYRVAFSQAYADRGRLEQFFANDPSDRSLEAADVLFSDVRSIFGIFELLQTYGDSRPAKAATQASFVHEWISERGHVSLDSERTYLLGRSALLVGANHRCIGQREAAAVWFERANCFLSSLRNAEPDLARLAYGRLALSYERKQFDLVVREVPFLLARFQELDMEEDEIKCLFVEAMALKESGSDQVALAKFLTLEKRLRETDSCRLLGAVLTQIGELYSAQGFHREAMQKYQSAFGLLRLSGRLNMIADLKAAVGETCRDMGKLHTAIELYRAAIDDYVELSMATFAAYGRIVLAETLLLAGRPREAEVEILAAIPTIERERMVQEGFAALNLLRESVNRSETDVESLRELRERLKGNVH